MTKAELVSIIRHQIDQTNNFKKREVSLKIISSVLDTLFTVMRDNITEGKHIELRGFGTFETKIREAKKAINPRTKEVVNVKRHAVPIFRPGKELKSMVKEYFEKNNKKK
jgi:nucleoid DNA-binding protein